MKYPGSCLLPVLWPALGAVVLATAALAVEASPGAAAAQPALADTIVPPEAKTAAEIKTAIIAALNSRHWVIQEQRENQVVATYTRRPIALTLTVKFDEEKIEVWSIGSGPSNRLQERAPTWIGNFAKDVRGLLGMAATGSGDPAQRVPFHLVAPRQKDGGVIYVYRLRSMVGAAVSWPITLDGRTMGKLRNSNYLALHVGPGRHVVAIPGASPAASGGIDVVPNRAYFLRADGATATPVTRDTAVKEIARLIERPVTGLDAPVGEALAAGAAGAAVETVPLTTALEEGRIRLTFFGDDGAVGTAAEGRMLGLMIGNNLPAPLQVVLPRGEHKYVLPAKQEIQFRLEEEQRLRIDREGVGIVRAVQTGMTRVVKGQATLEGMKGNFRVAYVDFNCAVRLDWPSGSSGAAAAPAGNAVGGQPESVKVQPGSPAAAAAPAIALTGKNADRESAPPEAAPGAKGIGSGPVSAGSDAKGGL